MMEWHEIVRLWAAVVLSAGMLGWTIYWSIAMYRRSAARSEQDELKQRIAKLEGAVAADEKADGSSFAEVKSRLQRVEDELKHMPTREQFHDIQLSIGTIKADFRELAANLRPIAASVERIDNFLMERAKA